MTEWYFGCRICNAIHKSSGINDYPDSIKVIRNPIGNNGVTVEYECLKHKEENEK